MSNIDQFKRHIGSAFHGIFVTTSGTKAAVTTERDKFKIATMGADIHSSAEGRIATAQHLIDIFHLRISGMEGIFDFLIIVSKDSLQDIHKSIMQEKGRKRNPLTPQD